MMTLREFLKIANQWDKMGTAVQSQLQAIVDGQGFEEQNDNALRMIAEFLRYADLHDVNDEGLGTEIVEYLEDDSE